MNDIFSTEIMTWVIIPLLIFLARITDVSIGTMRLIFVSKGYKYIAPVLGFFEIIIWLLAITQIMQHLDNWLCYLAYGLGFAAGNFIGILLEEKLSIGNVLIRVFPKKDTTILIEDLRDRGFGISVIEIQGKGGRKKMILSLVARKSINEFISTVLKHNPNAFYSVEDVKAVNDGGVLRYSQPKLISGLRRRKAK